MGIYHRQLNVFMPLSFIQKHFLRFLKVRLNARLEQINNVDSRRISYEMHTNSVDMYSLRTKYKEKNEVFLEENINVKEPISLFKEWLHIAINTDQIGEPNAACLATVNMQGFPSNRYVLIKDVTSEGFIFFTNYGSRKAKDILNNPYVAMTIYWHPLNRSVRIEGKAEKISLDDSQSYFRQRPRGSQISALVSAQSTVIKSRQELVEAEARIKNEVGEKEVPLPNWGGYLIRPHLVEFWQGQTDRLHDRIQFRRNSKIEDQKDENERSVQHGENGWIYERLAP